jgi:hypothetical protein
MPNFHFKKYIMRQALPQLRYFKNIFFVKTLIIN